MFFSIIIPIYNSEAYLEKCILSIVEQSFDSYEIILVDDGSNDKSSEICKKFLSDKRIKYFFKNNGGVSSARNYGLKIAQGEYIIFLDSDDFLEKEALVDYSKILTQKHDLICSSFKIVTKKRTMVNIFEERHYSRVDILNNLYNLMYIISATVGKVFKREIINKFNVQFNTSFSYSEDTLFNLTYLSYCNDIYVSNQIAYNIRRSTNTSSLSTKIFDNITDVYGVQFNIFSNILNSGFIEEKVKEQQLISYANKIAQTCINYYLTRLVNNNDLKYKILIICKWIKTVKNDFCFFYESRLYFSKKMIYFLNIGSINKFIYFWKLAHIFHSIKKRYKSIVFHLFKHHHFAKKAKKVFVIAYLKNNLGDDLFIDYTIKKYSNVVFYVWKNPHYLSAFKRQKNFYYPSSLLFFIDKVLRRLSGKNMGPIEKKWVLKSEAILKIGGSIFMETKNLKYNEVFRDKSRQKLFILGANFGPYYTQDYLDCVRKEIECSEDVCFRDKYSFDVFRDLPSVRYAPDILFNFPLPVVPEKNAVGICVVDVAKKPNLAIKKEWYLKTICDAADYFIKTGMKVYLFSFCKEEGDLRIANEIKAILKRKEEIKIVSYTGNNKDLFLTSFCECKFIVATRFHAMILGWKAQKRVFPIIYNQKTKHVIDDLGYSGGFWDLLNEKMISGEELAKQLLNIPRLMCVDSLEKSSESHFEQFNNFIKE